MNLLFEIVIQQGFLVDLFGVIGLGLVALAAIRLARQLSSESAKLMTWGALALMTGRVGFLIYASFVTPFNQAEFDPMLLDTVKNVNIGLLTGGFGMIVWGFWRHEQRLAEEPAR